MKIINYSIPGNPEQAEILPIADLHIGDPQSDWKNITSKIDYIKATPNVYTMLGGDLIDNATRASIGDIYSQKVNPNEALTLLVNLFQPVRDQIICIIGGNHERRTWRQDGVDLCEQLAQRLGIADRYSPETALINISINNIEYKIYLTHGAGSGRKAGAKINRLVELADIVSADVYIQGHTHTPMVTRNVKLDTTKTKINRKEQLFLNMAASLNFGGYGELAGFTPTSTINPQLFLNGRQKYAWAAL